MSNSGTLFLLVFFSFHCLTSSTTAIAPAPAVVAAPNTTFVTTPFIKEACRATRYYLLCIQCLTPFSKIVKQSERQIARVALAVSLGKARSAAVFVTKLASAKRLQPREYQALKDCMNNMADSVDQLNQSMQEMGRVNNRLAGQDFIWRMSNVQTWVSAALTDQNTCSDGFSGRYLYGAKFKVIVRRRVLYVAQVTSNALALVNRFASRYRPRINSAPSTVP
ncbi:OLC1v1029370C1 [Oldenlandia corymbosa var. corymbosa]|uniref:OLC1v1029370C1 n=1 Tax=Oldenlandia corymbosa var. corymbosa TaxID=529605 RepID=A0AAV1CGT1_OLDCO|nr:OLC1v1029370C1 [Oldenlandia corymbosa var. corymbosa]